MNKCKTITLIIIRLLCVLIFPISYIVDPEYAGKITFFTVQSNLFVLIIMICSSIYDILILCGKNIKMPNFIFYLKHISTTAISITFLVFGVILTPVLLKQELSNVVLSYSSIVMHQIIPVVAIIDWILDKPKKKVNYYFAPLAWSFPLYYYFFTLVIKEVGVTFPYYENGVTTESKFPYFFLDYEKYGWFRTDGEYIGVVYWLLIITLFVFAVSSLLILIKNLQFKKLQKPS